VVAWLRNRQRIPRPFGPKQLQPADVLLIRTTPEALVAIRKESGVELHPVVEHGDAETKKLERDTEEVADLLAQAIVAPGSDHAGRTIGEIDFRRRYGILVLGLWRRQGWLDEELAKTRLLPGDVLVLQGNKEALSRIEADRAFLMMVPFHAELRLRRKARLAGLIMVLSILATAFDLMRIEMAMMAGAAAMLLTRCLTPRQAYRAIDSRIIVFIAGAIPLGVAMQKSGTSNLLAGWLQYAVSGWDQKIVLLVLFFVASLITQLMSDSATTALFGPMAIALAEVLGHSPAAYVITVAMGSVTAFLTPIGHHGNLLVYGPGGYQFHDFIRMGLPLTIVFGIIVAWSAPAVFP
jgi:di/tricarboxylate transporter